MKTLAIATVLTLAAAAGGASAQSLPSNIPPQALKICATGFEQTNKGPNFNCLSPIIFCPTDKNYDTVQLIRELVPVTFKGKQGVRFHYGCAYGNQPK
ncbi:MAG: hypothetical protein AAF679_04180 [Pseudomonadota bacterium]